MTVRLHLTGVFVDDQDEALRFYSDGVTFTQRPTAMGPVTTAVLDDGCGNLIQLVAH